MKQIFVYINILISLWAKRNPKAYTKFLRKKGVTIGKNTKIYGNCTLDLTYPQLIKIGDKCTLSCCSLITHDGSRAVIQNKFGGRYFANGLISIGNNVFIGHGSIILRNVKIGDNCIIGAGSVVTKSFSQNCVIAGVPAKKIMSLTQFFKKRKKLQIKEAKKWVKIFKYDKRNISEKKMRGLCSELFNPRSGYSYNKLLKDCNISIK